MLRSRLVWLFLALLLIVLSWWNVATARTGLVVRSLQQEGVPLLYVAPQTTQNVPGVLVAHGFAGSKQLMLGYGQVLAHAGYAVMLWDFAGHGANAAPLGGVSLQKDLDIAYAALLEQPEVDATRLALVGHSMGSGAVMAASIANVNRFAATVAISPTGAQVTPSVPRNLQLQAGSWEGRFVGNAQQLLEKAGGENGNLASGRGRSLVIIPNAEHITILFRPVSHQAALQWLNATFGVPTLSRYVDRRMLWYGLHLLAWLIVLSCVAPTLAKPVSAYGKKTHWVRRWGGLLLSPLIAGSLLLLISRVIEIQSIGGLWVGGAVAIWFLIAGLVWQVFLFRLPHPTVKAVGLGVALFILFWVAFGAMAQFVWLQWWLIPARLQLWPLLSIVCLPWFLASGMAQQSASILQRVAWWLGQTVVLIAGFILVLNLLPQLSFVFLILPIFPPLIAILSLAAVWLDEWSYALGSAFFFGWMIAAAFPLAG